MALTKISEGGVKDDAASQAKIADEAVDEARLQVSNAGSNGQFLQKQSGNTGGLTWAAANEYTHPNHSGEVTSTGDGATVIASNIVDEDNLKISNAGTNGQYLQKQSGNTGGLTWADVTIPPSGNTVDLVADGAIAAGKPVIITTAGKAKQAGETVTENTSQVSNPGWDADGHYFNGNGSNEVIECNGVAFSETSNIGGWFFTDVHDSSKWTGREFNLNSSGNLNTPNAGNIGLGAGNGTLHGGQTNDIEACWDSQNNKFVTVGQNNATTKSVMTWVSVTPSSARLITGSGNSFDLQVSTVNSYKPKVCDCGSGRIATFVETYSSGNSVYNSYLTMFNWASGASNYTQGQSQYVHTGTSSNPICNVHLAYHTAEAKIVAVAEEQNSGGNIVCRLGTISGSGSSMDTSWGTQADVTTVHARFPKVSIDVNTGKVVIVYLKVSDTKWYSKVGTISGTTISFGSEALVDSVVGQNDDPHQFRPSLLYLKNLKKHIFAWVGLESETYKTWTKTGTVSGTDITWANKYIQWPSGDGIRGLAMVDLNDSSNNKVGAIGFNPHDGDHGQYKTLYFSSATTNINTNTNLIGFAEDAINDTATGTVKLYGNVVGNQSSLTAGTLYYHQTNGSLSTSGNNSIGNIKAGMALSSTKLLIYNPLT
tara:strand:- start:83 stop:2041 length:1959 start_codon:yes stop_codon:yes gene_type:complete